MKVGDYVRVTDNRGSFTGIIKEITKLAVSVECTCCFSWKICNPENVEKA